jgi:hypothetical protein
MRPVLILPALCVLLLAGGVALAQTQPAAPPAEEPGVDVVAPTPDLPKAQPADPRTIQQRASDRRAFERCLLRAQSASDDSGGYNPLRPDPVELCRQRTGMRTQDSLTTKR